MSLKRISCALVTLIAVTPVHSEVVDAAANGFTVKQSVVVAAETKVVYGAATGQIAKWWNADHTISGDATNLYIDARPHGCFCERLGADGGLIHLNVTFVNPGVMLGFSGGLGPLGLMGVNGNMTWEFESIEAGTRVTWHYAVGGYLAGGLDAIAPAVDGVLVEQLLRLKSLVEVGEANPPT